VNTSFMVPFWPHTEPGSAPIPVCEHLEATLVQRMLFIALMAVAQVSHNVFCSQGGFSQRTSEHYIIFGIHTRIHLCYRSYGIHFIYIMHSVYTFFFFTSLLIFLAGLLPLTLDVRYNIGYKTYRRQNVLVDKTYRQTKHIGYKRYSRHNISSTKHIGGQNISADKMYRRTAIEKLEIIFTCSFEF
jgi:hypothetical protein